MWVSGPEIPWEIYTVLADAPVMYPADSACCEADPATLGEKPKACC